MIDTAVSACSIGDDERRRQADAALAARQHQQAAAEARLLERLGGVVVGEVEADHQAAAADLLDERPLRRPARSSADSRWAPTLAALSARPDSTSSSVALAAAQATGLPPNVEPWPPGSQSITLGPGDDAGERQAAGEALADAHDVGLDAVVLARPHRAGAPDAGLHLVDDEQDAVRVAQRAQVGQPAGRRHDVAALALDRLDEDRRHVGRVGELLEQHLLDVVGAGQAAARRTGRSTGRGSCPA